MKKTFCLMTSGKLKGSIGGRSFRRMPYFAPTLLALALMASCQPAPKMLSGTTMGTTYSIKVADEVSSETLARIKSEAEMLLDRINDSMSTYIEDSELSRFNRSRSLEWQAVSAELATVLRYAQSVSKMSSGAFDITVGPLVDLWGFGPSDASEQRPSEQALAAVRGDIGHRWLQVSPDSPMIKKNLPRLSLDLSAIAKGYAVDQLAQLLYKNEVRNFLVEIGGELRAQGVNPREQIWRVGIENPDGQNVAERIVSLDNAAIATSGDYRIYREIDGQKYSHEINPRTGEPIVHLTSSVSVIADSAMVADAWATALLILGSEAGLKLAQRHNIAAYFIDRRADAEGGFSSLWSDAFEPHLAK